MQSDRPFLPTETPKHRNTDIRLPTPDFQTANRQPSLAMLPAPFHLQLTAIYKAAPEGGYTSTFEELPDVFSQGETIEEAKANLLDALDLVLSYHRDQARSDKGHESSTIRETFEFATP